MSHTPGGTHVRAARQHAVAVIIPTYNRSRLVVRAIQSVLGQTHPADEVIVIDDGSTDDTAETVAAYPSVRLLRKENGGPVLARNAAIAATSCEWVTFLDDDDWFHPHMIEEQVRVMAADPAVDLIYTATHHVDADGRVLGRTHRGHRLPRSPLAAMAVENLVLCSAVGVRRELLIRAGLFDPSVWLCEDYDLWLRVAATGARLAYVDRPLAYVTKHRGGRSASPQAMAEATLKVLSRRAPMLQSLVRGDGQAWWLGNAHYRLGRVYWEAGDLAAAAARFEEACEHDPGHRASRLYLWMARHPRLRRAFLNLRQGKRGVVGVLKHLGLAEGRWG